eukprot:snap_masked-scaffold_1-processed-gene-11.10-mRNA-1 protein AED:1.00 eAED:1.00 QI:0/-1/0/0/-1/1/1/0/1360
MENLPQTTQESKDFLLRLIKCSDSLEEVFSKNESNLSEKTRQLKELKSILENFQAALNVGATSEDSVKLESFHKRMSLAVGCLLKADIAGALKTSLFNVLSILEETNGTLIGIINLMFEVIDNFCEEFYYFPREKIAECPNDCKKFLIGCTKSFLRLAPTLCEYNHPDLLCIQRQAPLLLSNLLQKCRSNFKTLNFLFGEFLQKKSENGQEGNTELTPMFTEFIQIVPSFGDVPTQLNIVDAIFRILFALRSNPTIRSSRTEIIENIAKRLAFPGDKDDEKFCCVVASLFNSRSNEQYKKVLRSLVYYVNRKSSLASTAPCRASLIKFFKGHKDMPAIEVNVSKKAQFFQVDLNFSSLSLYTPDGSLFSVPISVLKNVEISGLKGNQDSGERLWLHLFFKKTVNLQTHFHDFLENLYSENSASGKMYQNLNAEYTCLSLCLGRKKRSDKDGGETVFSTATKQSCNGRIRLLQSFAANLKDRVEKLNIGQEVNTETKNSKCSTGIPVVRCHNRQGTISRTNLGTEEVIERDDDATMLNEQGSKKFLSTEHESSASKGKDTKNPVDTKKGYSLRKRENANLISAVGEHEISSVLRKEQPVDSNQLRRRSLRLQTQSVPIDRAKKTKVSSSTLSKNLNSKNFKDEEIVTSVSRPELKSSGPKMTSPRVNEEAVPAANKKLVRNRKIVREKGRDDGSVDRCWGQSRRNNEKEKDAKVLHAGAYSRTVRKLRKVEPDPEKSDPGNTRKEAIQVKRTRKGYCLNTRSLKPLKQSTRSPKERNNRPQKYLFHPSKKSEKKTVTSYEKQPHKYGSVGRSRGTTNTLKSLGKTFGRSLRNRSLSQVPTNLPPKGSVHGDDVASESSHDEIIIDSQQASLNRVQSMTILQLEHFLQNSKELPLQALYQSYFNRNDRSKWSSAGKRPKWLKKDLLRELNISLKKSQSHQQKAPKCEKTSCISKARSKRLLETVEKLLECKAKPIKRPYANKKTDMAEENSPENSATDCNKRTNSSPDEVVRGFDVAAESSHEGKRTETKSVLPIHLGCPDIRPLTSPSVQQVEENVHSRSTFNKGDDPLKAITTAMSNQSKLIQKLCCAQEENRKSTLAQQQYLQKELIRLKAKYNKRKRSTKTPSVKKKRQKHARSANFSGSSSSSGTGLPGIVHCPGKNSAKQNKCLVSKVLDRGSMEEELQLNSSSEGLQLQVIDNEAVLNYLRKIRKCTSRFVKKRHKLETKHEAEVTRIKGEIKATLVQTRRESLENFISVSEKKVYGIVENGVGILTQVQKEAETCIERPKGHPLQPFSMNTFFRNGISEKLEQTYSNLSSKILDDLKTTKSIANSQTANLRKARSKGEKDCHNFKEKISMLRSV